MAYVTIRDNVLWTKHIEGDSRLVERILALPENAPLRMLIEGTEVLFLKMRDGADGRPTPGLRPADPVSREFWEAMQERRGERVALTVDEFPDAQLESLSALLSEWASAEDAAAYDEL